MSRKIILAFACAFVFTYINAQNPIPNAGFENWTNLGNYEDPDDWGTINSLTSLIGIKTVTKATGTDAHSGSYAMKMESKTVPFQGTAPGIAATGVINPNTQAVDGGVVFNKRPYSLTGWFKYQPNGADTASVDALLFRWNSTSHQREIVGQATFEQSTTVSGYTQFTATFTYQLLAIPDTLVITVLTSSQGSDSPSGSVLFIDDLAFDYNCPSLSVTTLATNESAQGANDGAVNATATGGGSIYNYLWSDNSTLEDPTGLPSGNYCVTVTDVNGCTASSCALVSSPSCTGFSVSASGTNPTVVGGNDGFVIATADSGNIPYNYTWDTPNTTGLAAGTYCVTATDNGGCIATDCVTLTDPDCSAFSATATATDASSVTATDGAVSATPANGTAPYLYLWSTTDTTAALANVPRGQYCVTVTDSVGCSASDCADVGPDCSGFGVTVTSTPDTNGTHVGTATANIVGGTGPFQYIWNDGNSGQTATDLPSGPSCITASDASGCTAEDCDTVGTVGGVGNLAEAGINLFPNPVQNLVTIQLKDQESFRFRLFDAKGKLVKEEMLSSKTSTISVSEFPAGNYLVELLQVATGKAFSGKLLKN